MITSITTNNKKVSTVQLKFNGKYIVENQIFKSRIGLPVRAIVKAYLRLIVTWVLEK